MILSDNGIENGLLQLGADIIETDLPAEMVSREPCLAMRPREAANALGISQRLLWQWTNQGKVPHIRIGRAVLYPVSALRRWLDEPKTTLQELADQYGVSAERIRQLEKAALGKLKGMLEA